MTVLYRQLLSTGWSVTVLNITTLITSPYKVKGWTIELYEYTCVTHFFFWGSYSSTDNLKPQTSFSYKSSQPDCPHGYEEFKTEKDLLELCVWNWPRETTTKTSVCHNSAGGYYVNGMKAACSDYLCMTDSGVLFLHTTSIAALDLKTSTSVIEPDSLCTPQYCLVPRTMSLYKPIRILESIEGWHGGYESTTREIIYLRTLKNHEIIQNKTQDYMNTNRTKRDTSEDIRKIMYLEEETLRLDHRIDMLCCIIQQLKTLFWIFSGVEPTILARKALGQDNLVAESRHYVLLVWGCNTVYNWEFRPTKYRYHYLFSK